jgi:hypothetical protein
MTPNDKLERRRAQVARNFLVQCAEIWRQEPGVGDGYGGQKCQYAKTGKTPCRLQSASRAQRVEEGKQDVPLADWEVLLPVTVSVSFPDQLRIGGMIYEVMPSDSASPESIVQTVPVKRKD